MIELCGPDALLTPPEDEYALWTPPEGEQAPGAMFDDRDGPPRLPPRVIFYTSSVEHALEAIAIRRSVLPNSAARVAALGERVWRRRTIDSHDEAVDPYGAVATVEVFEGMGLAEPGLARYIRGRPEMLVGWELANAAVHKLLELRGLLTPEPASMDWHDQPKRLFGDPDGLPLHRRHRQR
jgi:hypothetical protein